MSIHPPVFQKIPWLRIEHIAFAKVGIGLGLVATYFVPPPYSYVVGVASNMVWLWKF